MRAYRIHDLRNIAPLVILGIGMSLFVNPTFVAAQSSGVSAEVVPNKINSPSLSASTSTRPPIGVGLAFETNGIVSGVYAYAGKHVSRGEILVALDSTEMLAQLHDAQATLDYQTIKLNQLKTASGASGTDAVTLQNYQTALDDIKLTIISTLQDSYTKAEDAVRNRVDQIFSQTPQSGPQFTLVNIVQGSANQLPGERASIESMLIAWKSSLDTLTAADDVNAYVSYELSNLNKVRNFVDDVVAVVNTAKPDATVSQSGLKNIKNDLFVGRSNTLTAINQLLTVRSKEHDAEMKLALQRAVMAKNDPTSALLLQTAVVKQAQSKVDLLTAQVNNMTLRAPADGIVSAVKVALGSTAAARAPVVYVKTLPSPSRSSDVTSLIGAAQSQAASVLTAIKQLSFAF